MIRYIRTIALTHKLIVGFEGWNGLKKMIASEPFAEPNIIHTFSELDVPNTWFKWGDNFDMFEKARPGSPTACGKPSILLRPQIGLKVA